MRINTKHQRVRQKLEDERKALVQRSIEGNPKLKVAAAERERERGVRQTDGEKEKGSDTMRQ